jgi:hypothetical protein
MAAMRGVVAVFFVGVISSANPPSSSASCRRAGLTTSRTKAKDNNEIAGTPIVEKGLPEKPGPVPGWCVFGKKGEFAVRGDFLPGRSRLDHGRQRRQPAD